MRKRKKGASEPHISLNLAAQTFSFTFSFLSFKFYFFFFITSKFYIKYNLIQLFLYKYLAKMTILLLKNLLLQSFIQFNYFNNQF